MGQLIQFPTPQRKPSLFDLLDSVPDTLDREGLMGLCDIHDADVRATLDEANWLNYVMDYQEVVASFGRHRNEKRLRSALEKLGGFDEHDIAWQIANPGRLLVLSSCA